MTTQEGHTRDPDGELAVRVRRGEQQAYRSLIERHYADCLRYAMQMLGNRHDAEEVVQDTFVRAHRALERYDTTRPFGPWLFTILVNQCRTAARTRGRRDMPLVSIELSEVMEWPGGEEENNPELGAALHVALRRLPERLREAVLLKYAQDWTYEEIAAATGAQMSAVKMRVKRGREQLERELRRNHAG